MAEKNAATTAKGGKNKKKEVSKNKAKKGKKKRKKKKKTDFPIWQRDKRSPFFSTLGLPLKDWANLQEKFCVFEFVCFFGHPEKRFSKMDYEEEDALERPKDHGEEVIERSPGIRKSKRGVFLSLLFLFSFFSLFLTNLPFSKKKKTAPVELQEPSWTPDQSSKACEKCGAQFTFTKRFCFSVFPHSSVQENS